MHVFYIKSFKTLQIFLIQGNGKTFNFLATERLDIVKVETAFKLHL